MKFAPPTPEEQKAISFAPPAPEELQTFAPPPAFAPPTEPDMSAFDAGLMGVQQGTTFGFSDEITGGIDALLRSTGDVLLPEGTTNPYAKQSLAETYQKARDEYRDRLKEAREQHGGAVLAGEVLGGFLIPGSAMGKALTWKQAAKVGAATGAVEGGIAGAGYNEDIERIYEDILLGIGVGGTAGGLIGGALGRFKQGTSQKFEETVMRDAIEPTIIIRAEKAARDAAEDNTRLMNVFTAKEFEPATFIRTSKSPEEQQTLLRFMNYVTRRDNKPILKVDDVPFETIEELSEEFIEASRKGNVTKEAFNEFKLGEYMMQAMDQDDKARYLFYMKGVGKDPAMDKIIKQSIKNYDVKDPLKGLKKYVLDAQVAAREIDDAAGLDVELLHNRLYEQSNRKKGFDREIASIHKAARKLRRKNNISDEEMIKLLESGNTSNPAVQAYRDTLDYLLERSRSLGLEVKKRKNYVPLKKKTGVDMIITLEKMAKKLGVMDNPNNAILKSVLADLRKIPDESAASRYLNDLKGSRRDLAFLVDYLKKHWNTEIVSGEQLKSAVKALRSPDSLQRTLDPQVNALFERRGVMPDWMREKNIDKLIFLNTDQASNAIFINPVARALDSRIEVLKRMGLTEAYDWLKNYRMDISGMQRNHGVVDSLSNKLKMKLSLAGEDMDSDMLRYAPAMLDTVASSIYPNLLGMSVRTVARNLTQPLTMTMADMGVKDSGGMIAKAYGKMIRDVAKRGWKSVREDAVSRGLIPETVGLGDFEGIASGVGQYVKSKGIQTTADVIEKYGKVAMWGFNKSDEINRIVAASVGDQIADRILKGDHKWFNKLPDSISNKVRFVLENGGGEAEVRKIVSQWMTTSSQLVYGKIGAHQLGRDWGPALMMLAKWPVAIGSDIYNKASKKEYMRLMSKYMGPVIATTLLSRAWADKQDMSPREKALIGSGGLPTWLPITSIFSAPDVAVPLNLQTGLQLGQSAFTFGTKAGMGKLTKQDKKKIKHNMKRAFIQYTPVAGGLWRAYDNNIRDIIFNEGE